MEKAGPAQSERPPRRHSRPDPLRRGGRERQGHRRRRRAAYNGGAGATGELGTFGTDGGAAETAGVDGSEYPGGEPGTQIEGGIGGYGCENPAGNGGNGARGIGGKGGNSGIETGPGGGGGGSSLVPPLGSSVLASPTASPLVEITWEPPPSPPTVGNTVLGSHPKKTIKTRKKKVKVKFSFSSNVAGATFKCKLDKGSFALCTSPKTYKVKLGSHTFSVKAVTAGGTDPTPAKFSFKVKKKQ
jgi:hypothetical protein